MIRNPRFLLVAQSLLALALLAAWLAYVDLTPVATRLAAVAWHVVALALGLGMLASLARTARWQLLLRPIARVPLRGIAPIVFASTLVNFLLPLRTGEIARSLLLRQRHGVTVPGSLGTLAVDRALDLTVVLALAGCGMMLVPRGAALWEKWVLGGVVLLLGLATLVVLASRRRGADAEQSRAAGATIRTGLHMPGVVQRFLDGLSSSARSPRTLAAALGLTLVALALDSAAFYALFTGVGGREGPALVVLGYALFVLTFLVPAAPGYIGTAEALGTLVFVTLGLPVDLASSAILLFHAANAILVLVLGLLGFAWMGLRPSAAFESVLRRRATGAEARLEVEPPV
jgi:uncharacterized protein (TIRG00374 family)